ncbi:halocyanin [Halobacteriales archaeon QS_8_65_32]|nr:MAG: halocyanin [Halobacteriales archaeon QS_8_65_32]
MERRAFLTAIAGASAVGLAGCLGSGQSIEYDIGMSANAFMPEQFEISVGDTVTWANTGSRNHSVTAYASAVPEEATYFASGGFDSEKAARNAWFGRGEGVISSNETYEHTFSVPGRYDYFCIPHEPTGMVGAIVVEE